MLGQRSVAGLAIDVGVLTLGFLVEDVRVTGFAALVAGEVHWPGGNFGNSISAIVSVLSETLWDEKTTDEQKEEQAGKEDSSQAKEMSCVLEGIHAMLSGSNLCRELPQSARQSVNPSFLITTKQVSPRCAPHHR